MVNAYSGEVLDDPSFSTSNGTLIQQYQLNGGLNQQWQIVPRANGDDEVFNAYSGKVLDDPSFSTATGPSSSSTSSTGSQPAVEAVGGGIAPS